MNNGYKALIGEDSLAEEDSLQKSAVKSLSSMNEVHQYLTLSNLGG